MTLVCIYHATNSYFHYADSHSDPSSTPKRSGFERVAIGGDLSCIGVEEVRDLQAWDSPYKLIGCLCLCTHEHAIEHTTHPSACRVRLSKIMIIVAMYVEEIRLLPGKEDSSENSSNYRFLILKTLRGRLVDHQKCLNWS